MTGVISFIDIFQIKQIDTRAWNVQITFPFRIEVVLTYKVGLWLLHVKLDSFRFENIRE